MGRCTRPRPRRRQQRRWNIARRDWSTACILNSDFNGRTITYAIRSSYQYRCPASAFRDDCPLVRPARPAEGKTGQSARTAAAAGPTASATKAATAAGATRTATAEATATAARTTRSTTAAAAGPTTSATTSATAAGATRTATAEATATAARTTR